MSSLNVIFLHGSCHVSAHKLSYFCTEWFYPETNSCDSALMFVNVVTLTAMLIVLNCAVNVTVPIKFGVDSICTIATTYALNLCY